MRLKLILTAFVICLLLKSGKLSAQIFGKNLTKSDTVEALLNVATKYKLKSEKCEEEKKALSDSIKLERRFFSQEMPRQKKKSRKEGFTAGVIFTIVLEIVILLSAK